MKSTWFNRFLAKAKKVAPLGGKFEKTPEQWAQMRSITREVRKLKCGRRAHGWFGLVDRAARAAKDGRSVVVDVLAMVEEIGKIGKDNAARHVHPRHFRAAS